MSYYTTSHAQRAPVYVACLAGDQKHHLQQNGRKELSQDIVDIIGISSGCCKFATRTWLPVNTASSLAFFNMPLFLLLQREHGLRTRRI
jgi:hypothetical protein